MARLSVLLALALAALAACDAQVRQPHANANANANTNVDAASVARHDFKQAVRRSLTHCAGHTSTRQLHERSEKRRHAQWQELCTATNHKAKDVDVTTRFSAKHGATVLEPVATKAPFYVASERVRNDIREDQPGIDLYMELQIIDVKTCEPVSGLYLDFWHCNATGVYSGVVRGKFINGEASDGSNTHTTFHRGLAPTNADGVVQFVTKFPGHDTMQTPHIHVLGNHGGKLLENNTFVRSTTVSNVGQIFFDQDLIAQVEATGVYKTNTQPMTTNAEDVFFVDEASTGFDPIVQYALLGDSVEDGIFAWLSVGVDLQHTAQVHSAATSTGNGNGVANAEPFGLGEPPFMQLDAAASSGANDTIVVPEPTKAPANYHPIFAFILIALALVITTSVETDLTSMAASVGVYVAVYSLVYGTSLSDAIGLAIVTTTGTGLAVFVENVRTSAKETEEQSHIDFDLLLVLQPSLLIGVIIGVYARWMVPEWFLSSVLATVLLICGSLLLQASHRRPDETVGWSINENSSLLEKPQVANDTPSFSEAIQKIPMDKLSVLVSVVLGVVVLQAALVVAVPVVLLVYLGYKSYKTTVDTFERQQLPRVQPSDGEMKWTWHVVHTLPVASALDGVMVGIFGLGSDVIIKPFVVEAGLSKSVAAVTCPTIVLLSGMLGALEYMAEGNGNSTFVFLVVLLAFTIKMWGKDVMQRYVPENFRGQSLLLLAFAVITLVSGVALAVALA